MRLIFVAMLVALVLAVDHRRAERRQAVQRFDYTFTFFGFLFLSMPSFWIAQLLKTGGIAFNQTRPVPQSSSPSATSPTSRRPVRGTSSSTSAGT